MEFVECIDIKNNCKITKGKSYKVLQIFHNEILIVNDSNENGWYDKKLFKQGDDKNMNKAYKHEAICKKLNKIYEQKNADYNDSFAKARKEVQNYTLGKLYDKFERFKQLTRSENQVKSESIEDTLIDLANYAIMELLERGLDNDNK